jgi:hypothetical protein
MLRYFLLLFLAAALSGAVPGQAMAQQEAFASSIEQLLGEDHQYAIDFLFFTHLAEVQLRFFQTGQPGVFCAQLVGRTLGVVSWLTGERIQTYTAFMELTPTGALRSIEYISRIDKRRWGDRHIRERYYRFDYEQGRIFDEHSEDGRSSSTTVYDIPAGQQPVDMLTALYNLRTGAYGTLLRGTRLRIPTYSEGSFTNIETEALTLVQQVEQSYFPSQGLLVQVKVDPEIFGTGSGNLYVWFDDAGVPRRGIIEDQIGNGDIRGHEVMEGS